MTHIIPLIEPTTITLEAAARLYWENARATLRAARNNDMPRTVGHQARLIHIIEQQQLPKSLQKRLVNLSALTTTLVANHARARGHTTTATLVESPRQALQFTTPTTTNNSEPSARPGRPPAAPCAPHRRLDATHRKNREIFKKGDEIILAVKTPTGEIGDLFGILGKQNMMTGSWYVMTPDWQGYAPEKSLQHAPSHQGGDQS